MDKSQKRINVLFDILENLGCFILRRGAVESYYAFSPNTTLNGKPSAAANEVSYWEEKVMNKYMLNSPTLFVLYNLLHLIKR